MKSLVLAMTILMTLLAAVADDNPEATSKVQKVYRKSEQHEYSGSKLKGQLKKPELSYIYQRKGLRAERIVNVPENFDEEIISGAGQF